MFPSWVPTTFTAAPATGAPFSLSVTRPVTTPTRAGQRIAATARSAFGGGAAATRGGAAECSNSATRTPVDTTADMWKVLQVVASPELRPAASDWRPPGG